MLRCASPPCLSDHVRHGMQRGQLGHGDLRQRNVPTLVAALKEHTSIAGAGGKNHSAVVTSAGDSWAFGLNSSVRSDRYLHKRVCDGWRASCRVRFTCMPCVIMPRVLCRHDLCSCWLSGSARDRQHKEQGQRSRRCAAAALAQMLVLTCSLCSETTWKAYALTSA